MARCGCASSSCNCSVVAGDNTTVTGDGSAANPYVINADGTSLVANDTNTVNHTLTGDAETGYTLVSDVIVDPEGTNLLVATPNGLDVPCESVQDCVGAAMVAGCGLTYDDAGNTMSAEISVQGGNTIQCLPDGLFSAPGAIALGCGLTTDGLGNIEVNTPATFGDLTRRNCNDNADVAGTTVLPGPDTEGMAVYCDQNGDLRTKPEKFSEIAQSAINEGYSPSITALPFTSSAIQIGATNPSSQYCMCGMVYFAFIPAISGAPGTVVEVNHEVDMGDGVFNAVTGFVMDNRGKSANSGATSRPLLALNVCLDPGETKIIRHRVMIERVTGDNGGAVSISGLAREIRFNGVNL